MADEGALGEGERGWRQRRDGVGGAQSELVRALWVSFPELVFTSEARKAEFEAECHARVTQWACVYVRAARCQRGARQRLDGGLGVAAIS